MWFFSGTYVRHGWLRRLPQAGCAAAVTPGTTGSTRLDGIVGDSAIQICEVPLRGSASLNDQTGCVPLGAAIVTRIRVPAR